MGTAYGVVRSVFERWEIFPESKRARQPPCRRRDLFAIAEAFLDSQLPIGVHALYK